MTLKLSPPWQEKHRASSFKDIAGQETALRLVSGMLKSGQIPQSILITGQTGCGKTSLARLIAYRLCPSKSDIFESNASEDTGIDAMRSLIESARIKPMHDPFKVFLVDEIQGLTKNAASAALSFLEKPPAHVVLIMTTDQPERMLKTLRDRAKIIPLKPLSEDAIYKTLIRIANEENIFQPIESFDKLFKTLAHVFTGSARPAIDALYDLSLIHASRPIKKEDIAAQINKVLAFDYRDSARFINLWYSGKGTDALKILNTIEDVPAFASLLSNIHHYMLKKYAGLDVPFDYLGAAATKGLSKLNPKLIADNLDICLELRKESLAPMGRNPIHLLFSYIMKLKETG